MSQSRARRMQEQSWMYDRLIRFGGPDFYWPMTQEVLNASGMTGWGDVMSVRAGVRRMADLTREMRRIVTNGFGNAKLAGRQEMIAADVADSRTARRQRIGF